MEAAAGAVQAVLGASAIIFGALALLAIVALWLCDGYEVGLYRWGISRPPRPTMIGPMTLELWLFKKS